MATKTSGLPPSPTTVVRFPRRQWVTLDGQLFISSIATAELVWDLPSPLSGPDVFRSTTVPAARVAQLVRAGRLWVGTAGRSVDFSLAIRPVLAEDGDNANKKKGLAPVRAAVSAVVIKPWLQVKLRKAAVATLTIGPKGPSELLALRSNSQEGEDDWAQPKHRRHGTDSVLLSLVNQPTTASAANGLYAPRGAIPQARFRRVACQLELGGLPKDIRKLSDRRSNTKSKRQNRDRSSQRPPSKDQGPTPLNQALFRNKDVWHKTKALLEVSLGSIMGGGHRVHGVRPIATTPRDNTGASLVNVAPAVWSPSYFQAVKSRSVHVPLISRLLATLIDAQSPSLRRKVGALVSGTEKQEHDEKDDDKTAQGSADVLRTKLEEIVLRCLLPQIPSQTPQPAPTMGCRVKPRPLVVISPPSAVAGQTRERLAVACRKALAPNGTHLHSKPVKSKQSGQPNNITDNNISASQDETIFGVEEYCNICLEDLESAFSILSSDGIDEDISEEGTMRNVGLQDIDAWSELYTLSSDDGEKDSDFYEEIDESWLFDERYGPSSDNEEWLGESPSQGSSYNIIADRHAVADRHLEECWSTFDSHETAFDETVSTGEEGREEECEDQCFVDIDEMDLDEGIGLWRNEAEVIEACC